MPTINQSGNTIYTTLGYTYQWFLSGVLIGGATGQSYNPPASGNFTVIVTDSNGCSAESNPYDFTLTPIMNFENNKINIYPNPANEQLFITFKNLEIRIIQILDISGRVLYTSNSNMEDIKSINIDFLNSGIYFLNIQSQDKYIFKFIKQ